MYEELMEEFVSDVINTIEMDPDSVEFPFQYLFATRVLWVQLSQAHEWWLVERRKDGLASLPLYRLSRRLRHRSRYSEGEGNFLVGPTRRSFLGTTKWMYGFDLPACFNAGLDTPDRLPLLQLPGTRVYTHDSEGVLYEDLTDTERPTTSAVVAPVGEG